MSDTRIPWATKTWNVTAGCSEVSAGCDNCYARALAWRFQHNPNESMQAAYHDLVAKTEDGRLHWTGEIRFLPERLAEPLYWRESQRVFVCSQSDLFHPGLREADCDRILWTMGRVNWHTFMALTKRPAWMRLCLGKKPLLPNLWLGVSVENQIAADERIPLLLETPAALHYVSCEPLLAPVNLADYLGDEPGKLQWVIAGSETGSGARPAELDWFRSLRDECVNAGVPYFLKQMGRRADYDTALDGREWRGLS